MRRRIAIIQGHPDPAKIHYGHALADAYAKGATDAGHEVRRINVADLDFALLRTQADWLQGAVPSGLAEANQDLLWAEHLVIIFPLWLGSMPALLKGFLEQVLRVNANPDATGSTTSDYTKPLRGTSVRIIVTMGMPAFSFRVFYLSHGVRFIERNIFKFCGAGPVRTRIIGMVEGPAKARARWLARMTNTDASPADGRTLTQMTCDEIEPRLLSGGSGLALGFGAGNAKLLVQHLHHGQRLRACDGIVNTFAVTSCIYQTFVTQHTQLLRQRWLMNVQRFLQVAYAAFPLCDLAKQHQAVGIGQRLQHAASAGGRGAHRVKVNCGG